jgi:5-methylcytosine-specific restriction endonuclease McrA
MGAMKDFELEMDEHPDATQEEYHLFANATPAVIRLEVLRRSNHRCEDCGTNTQPLELHHRHYRCVGSELPSDYDALCRSCHHGRHRDLNGAFWSDPEAEEDAWFGYHHAMGKDD